jgi:hypothetical protein
MLNQLVRILLISVALFVAACSAESEPQAALQLPTQPVVTATTQAAEPTPATTSMKTPMPTPTVTEQLNRPPATDITMYDFTSRATTGQWYIVNDSVMGGISESAATLAEPGVLVFTGTLSLENFGGFASLRSEPTSYGVANASALRLRVLGDGQRYHLQLHTDNRIDGVVYDQAFETNAGEWREVVLPINGFVPQFRGRVLANRPALDPANISSLTIMITDKQVGDFSLMVDWISAVPGDLSAENTQFNSNRTTQ